MMQPRAVVRFLPDNRRLHLQDGPIDLIIEANGQPDAVRVAYEAAERRFVTILDELCAELPLLRTAVNGDSAGNCSTDARREGTASEAAEKLSFCHPEPAPFAGEGSAVRRSPGKKQIPHPVQNTNEVRNDIVASFSAACSAIHGTGRILKGAIARRMFEAVSPYAQRSFITPMAAVAGAVSEAVLESMTSAANLQRAYVNNGGDIALHLAAGESFTIGMVDRPDCPSLFGTTEISSNDPIRGVATSGWRGRSFSLGIADAVTVLADSAAAADAAATVIANAVDVPGHASIVRVRACEISPDSDLGERLVTRGVGELTAQEVEHALDAGAAVAEQLLRRGLIRAAALSLCNTRRIVSPPSDKLGFAAPQRIAQHA
jgi:ApbE superfamily uncharacterized protein (UPF0280 family)